MRVAAYVCAFSLIPAAWLGLAAQAPSRPGGIGYVSTQRITDETTEGKASVARVQAFQRDAAAEVREKQRALEATRSQLPLAQAAARSQLEQQEQRQRVELERAVQKAQADVQALQREASGAVVANVRKAVEHVVRGRNIQVVLNYESSVVWAAPGVDLTNEVIARMNATPPALPK